ncbi:MAG: GntR family transcriptional regulator, partial [Burkholderiaceae bacterium]
MSDPVRPEQIASRIVDAIQAGKLAAGARLGEQALADLFGVSRTLVREALARLAARGMVEVRSRRGWFVVEPSRDHALEAFSAREAIETGLLQTLPPSLPAGAIERLNEHVAEERRALSGPDAGERSYCLGDFHVCLAECTGNGLLAKILRDLTARTTLIAALYQSSQEASVSCDEHAQIVAALEAGNRKRAVSLMRQHIRNVAGHLGPDAAQHDPLAPL